MQYYIIVWLLFCIILEKTMISLHIYTCVYTHIYIIYIYIYTYIYCAAITPPRPQNEYIMSAKKNNNKQPTAALETGDPVGLVFFNTCSPQSPPSRKNNRYYCFVQKVAQCSDMNEKSILWLLQFLVFEIVDG